MVSRTAPQDGEVRRVICKFVDYLQRHIIVQKAILFGSHAYGEPHEWSDIDVAIISPDFAGQPMMERLQFLYRAAWEAGTSWIEPLGYTLEELESASPLSIPGEIRERGVVVYEAEPSDVEEAVRSDPEKIPRTMLGM